MFFFFVDDNRNPRHAPTTYDPTAVHVFVPAGGGAATIAPATPLRGSIISSTTPGASSGSKKESKTSNDDKIEEGTLHHSFAPPSFV
jgi:hypothetical protein